MRKLIIFGNGLGRALNPIYFDFAEGMHQAWASETGLTDEEKTILLSALGETCTDTGPSHEDDLLGIQIAQTACSLIANLVGNENISLWLTDNALKVERAIEKYVFQVANYFQSYEFAEFDENWKDFTGHFCSFIHSSNSHVATLNYDSLLYSVFNEQMTFNGRILPRLCDGYNGKLLDGYTLGLGFCEENFIRYNVSKKSFYLHLHGSPLFVESSEGKIVKRLRSEANTLPENRCHVVLAHGKLKPNVIAESPVLSLYWKMLNEAISEAGEIVVFGYGGGDDHLNDKLKRRAAEIQVHVVEYEAPNETTRQRESYWKGLVGGAVRVSRLPNILLFRDW